jgi:small subunit ribosomal protein S9
MMAEAEETTPTSQADAAPSPPPAEPQPAPQAEEAPAPAAPPAEKPPQAEGKTEAAPKAEEEAKPKVEHQRPARPLPDGQHYVWGLGRRKKAVARVRIRPGLGKILVNKRDVEEYFVKAKDLRSVLAPLMTVRMRKSWDIWVNVGGGGYTGQAGAVMLGLARALAKAMPELEAALRDGGLMTRDARMPERKKYGQKGARKRFQFSKR